MNAILTRNPAPEARLRLDCRGYWSGLSVVLFVVLLSVFTWVVQRRVAQYESIQQAGGHHMTATKVCLTDRNQMSAPSIDGAGAAACGAILFGFVLSGWAMFFVACGFVDSHLNECGLKALLVLALEASLSSLARMKRDLTYFFFLPPPSFSSAS